MNIEIFYISYDGVVTQSVFDSQVSGFLKKLNKNKDFTVSLISFENLKSFFLKWKKLFAKKEEIVNNLGIRAAIYPRIPGYTGMYCSILLLLPFFFYKAVRKSKVILHARGNKAAFLACKMKSFFPFFKVIYSARGVEPEEYIYRTQLQYSRNKFVLNKLKKIFYKLKKVERYIVNNSDKILCVSNEFRKHYLAEYKISIGKISVIPCCVDSSIFHFSEDIRRKIRDKLELREELVFVYSGSMKYLQMMKSIIMFFKEIYKLDKRVFFLILTKNFKEAERFLQEESVQEGSYKILSVEYNQVPLYLNASDVGMILRDNNLVNEVACPTKFAEYMACGLYTILTDGIGDISKIVKEKRIGEVLSSLKLSEIRLVLNKILSQKKEIKNLENKKKISKLANNMFGWDSYINDIYLLHKELLK
jgi:glycosyltransferase involved in cell wall biosynthesis